MIELRAVAEKLAPPKEEGDDTDTADYDRVYLHERMLVIQEACKVYDKKTAKSSIAGLRQKKWPPPINEKLESMPEHMLSGDFDKVIHSAESIIEMLDVRC